MRVAPAVSASVRPPARASAGPGSNLSMRNDSSRRRLSATRSSATHSLRAFCQRPSTAVSSPAPSAPRQAIDVTVVASSGNRRRSRNAAGSRSTRSRRRRPTTRIGPSAPARAYTPCPVASRSPRRSANAPVGVSMSTCDAHRLEPDRCRRDVGDAVALREVHRGQQIFDRGVVGGRGAVGLDLPGRRRGGRVRRRHVQDREGLPLPADRDVPNLRPIEGGHQSRAPGDPLRHLRAAPPVDDEDRRHRRGDDRQRHEPALLHAPAPRPGQRRRRSAPAPATR